jgi:hypothetical protein
MIKQLTAVALFATICGSALAQSAQPHVMVYKTKQKYASLVPVQLSDKKDKIVSYPAPADLKVNGELATPIMLSKAYYLDRRGVNAHTAFTSFTYGQYAELKNTPSEKILMNHIKDKDPFVELYDCGPSTPENSTKDALNDIIRKDLLAKKCKRVK